MTASICSTASNILSFSVSNTEWFFPILSLNFRQDGTKPLGVLDPVEQQKYLH